MTTYDRDVIDPIYETALLQPSYTMMQYRLKVQSLFRVVKRYNRVVRIRRDNPLLL